MAEPSPATAPRCACGTEIGAGLLICPSCHRLIHGDELKGLAREAERLTAEGRLADARDLWRRALPLLPAGAAQFEAVAGKVTALNERLGPGARAEEPRPDWIKRLGPFGVVGLLVWKLKAVALFVGTKLKLLLLGFTKGGTLLTMFAALVVYWQIWGWKFAALFLLGMYVHEMGHVAALAHYGIAASAPMFVPGLGAFVRLKQYPATPGEDARVGLAGPLWGLGASLVALGIFLATRNPLWAAVARATGWLNLFNLLPVWQLDGSRGFRALAGWQRWIAALVLLVMWGVTDSGLALFIGLVALAQTFFMKAPAKDDHAMFALYVLLSVALALLASLTVPGAGATPAGLPDP